MVFYLGLIWYFGDLLKYEIFAFKWLFGIYGIFFRLWDLFGIYEIFKGLWAFLGILGFSWDLWDSIGVYDIF